MATSRICSIPNCGKRHKARGFCGSHYMRWLAHGDANAGRTPPGDPERFVRDIAFNYEGSACLEWPYARSSTGYATLKIGFGKNAMVSRIVCQHANGDAPTPQHEAAHSCGNGHLGCVNPRHLSWKTHMDNEADKRLHGTLQRGERNGKTRLTEVEVRAVRADRGKVPIRETASIYGISEVCVSQIQNRKRWGWLD